MLICCFFRCFFFKQKTAYEMRISDWSSDVCSSDLRAFAQQLLVGLGFPAGHIHEFNDAGEADRFIDTYPKCYVLKFSGPDFASSDNYVGWSADGRDVQAMLRRRRGVDGTFILMDFLERSEEHTSELQSLMRISY